MKADGTVVTQSGGISLLSHPSAGTYILDFGASVAGKLILASSGVIDSVSRGEVLAGPCGGTTEGTTCSAGNDVNHVFVQTQSTAGAGADHAFYVAVIG